jgi:hypothetical protein
LSLIVTPCRSLALQDGAQQLADQVAALALHELWERLPHLVAVEGQGPLRRSMCDAVAHRHLLWLEEPLG